MHKTTYIPARRYDEYVVTLHEHARLGPAKWHYSSSSAFAWDEYTLITCAHSVHRAKRAGDIHIEGLKARPVQMLRPKGWKLHENADVAILRFAKPHGLPVARRCQTDIAVGMRVFTALVPDMPVTFGQVSHIHALHGGRKWRTFTCNLPPKAGHSGSPIFSSYGTLIGMAIAEGTAAKNGRGKRFGIYIPLADLAAALTRLENENPR